MNTDSDVRVPLQHLYGFLIPGAGKHHRDGNRKASVDESFERRVHAVTHPGIITPDDQVDLIVAGRTIRRIGLTLHAGRRKE